MKVINKMLQFSKIGPLDVAIKLMGSRSQKITEGQIGKNSGKRLLATPLENTRKR